MPRTLTVNDATVLKLTVFAILEGYGETTPSEKEIMDAGIPTPPWPTDEVMNAINRLRIDGKSVVSTHPTRKNARRPYEYDYPLEDTELAGHIPTVCQALVVRMRQLLLLPPVPDEQFPKDMDRATVDKLAASIEILDPPETVH